MADLIPDMLMELMEGVVAGWGVGEGVDVGGGVEVVVKVVVVGEGTSGVGGGGDGGVVFSVCPHCLAFYRHPQTRNRHEKGM